ncbi:formyltransferase family protein [Clostridium sp. KNHs214]|uniref:formyltransferase family protein n=1 Tax=Clostridium sp. KNHs214 TaxID=1540257 RepID=UPI00055261F0|nr:formyltransferase family protein [Clostridium sp. KNHs214]
MLITLMCDNPNSWIIPYIEELKEEIKELGHKVRVIDDYKKITSGDLLFLLSCEKILPVSYMKMNKHNLVVHESDLPMGKGWSPVTWQVLEGKDTIPVTLFEAAESVDAGNIYLQEFIHLDGSELLEEIKHKQGLYTKKLVLEFIKRYPNVQGKSQQGEECFYPKRSPKDSQLDINKTIGEQFNLLRVVDNERYPAYFMLNGKKYIVKIYREE